VTATRAVRHQLATEQAGARLKEGKLEDERERLPRLVGFVQANEPRLLAFDEYADEEGTEVGVVQVHRDAESMEFHMKTVADRAARAYAETLEATTSIQVYGTPSEAVLQMLIGRPGRVRRWL
jgi:quinol monooxygenase YgiN